MNDKDDAPFPAFREALRASKFARQLPNMTFYRYAKGELPANWELLLRDPLVCEALAEDARNMTERDFKKWDRTVATRSKKAKTRRAK